jgi:integrase
MLLPVSPIVSVQTRYIQPRGSVLQFVMRVPSDLVQRYGRKFVRLSLRTSDPREAIERAEPLLKKYQAEFDSLRRNENVTGPVLAESALETAKAWGSLDLFMSLVIDPKRETYARGDIERYEEAEASDFLSPLEQQVLKVFKEGVDVVRLSDAIKFYWKTHKKAGDPDFVVAVERDWNKLVAHTGDIPLQDLTREHARTLIDRLAAAGNKTTSIRRSLNHIKAVVSAAIREAELAKVNPFAALQIANEGQDAEAAAVPDRKTLESIARALWDDVTPVGILSMILMETGTRIGEFSGMKVSDVFLDAPVPYVRIKPNEWRTVKTASSVREFPLVGLSLEAMKKALALPRTTDALFPAYARKRGQDSASAAVNKRLQKWGITSKSFRHSLKDRLREVGCPKDIRDAIQGHENGEVAEVYGLGHTLKTMQDWLEKAKVAL